MLIFFPFFSPPPNRPIARIFTTVADTEGNADEREQQTNAGSYNNDRTKKPIWVSIMICFGGLTNVQAVKFSIFLSSRSSQHGGGLRGVHMGAETGKARGYNRRGSLNRFQPLGGREISKCRVGPILLGLRSRPLGESSEMLLQPHAFGTFLNHSPPTQRRTLRNQGKPPDAQKQNTTIQEPALDAASPCVPADKPINETGRAVQLSCLLLALQAFLALMHA